MKEYKESYKRRLQKKRYVNKNRLIINKKSLKRRNLILQSWIGTIPKHTNCEVCKTPIEFMNKQRPIFFDHRNAGIEVIKTPPTNWISLRYATPKNIAIWKSCDFGMLCRYCNQFLPTKNRKEFLLKAIKYTFGENEKI